MHPSIFQWGSVSLSSYGFAMAAAFLLVVWSASAASRALGASVPMSPVELSDWACWTIVGGIAGGRVLYVLLNWEAYAAHPAEIVALWHGGLVWYGGFFGGLAATAVYAKRHGHAWLRSVDQVIPFVALGHAVGRIGCFFNGCCYGKPTASWCGVLFPGHQEPVIPTQLIESFSLVVLFVVLRNLQKPRVLERPGLLFGWYLTGYAVIRAVIECWRDQPVWWNGLTLAQLLSVALFVVGVGLVISRRRGPAGGAAIARGLRSCA